MYLNIIHNRDKGTLMLYHSTIYVLLNFKKEEEFVVPQVVRFEFKCLVYNASWANEDKVLMIRPCKNYTAPLFAFCDQWQRIICPLPADINSVLAKCPDVVGSVCSKCTA
jgi:hypothetical protein